MAQNPRTTALTNSNEKGDTWKVNGKKEHVRKKVWRPKTKTGCVTCRIRRVKCDEAKPSCQRCVSTGRKCDGYTTSAVTAQSYAIVYTPPQLPLPSMPGVFLHSTEEQEAFHFFKNYTASELAGFFDSSFWQFEVLQASHTLPAIRHAIVAMAALHRKFIVGRMPVVPDETSDEQLQFALQQSNRAIQELRKSPARKTISDSLDMMTACILFYCLACFQGHQEVALEQLRSGLKILHEVDRSVGDAEDLDHHPIKLHTLRAMFVTMDVQARGIMSDESLSEWVPHPKRKFLAPPAKFRTFAQARYFFESAFIDILAFHQELDVNPPTDAGASQRVKEQLQEHQRQTQEMSDRLDEFLAQLSHITNEEDRESILGIRLFREQVKVFLKIYKGFDGVKHVREIDWHIDEQDMGVILDLASDLLKAPADLSIPVGAVPEDYYPFPSDVENVSQMKLPAYSRPVFSSCSGLLSALWLVAARAKSFRLRRRAIALMLDFPRREGVWDSVLAGRIAWESLVLEETAVDGDLGVRRGCSDAKSEYIPEGNRVRSVDIRYVAARVMEVEFRGVTQYEAGQSGVKKLIAW